MADAAQPPASGTSASLQVTEDVAKKFPELIVLIKRSESMNDEERQYWVNLLPVMTPDQIQNLKDILDNEKKQLQAINQKYAQPQSTQATPANPEVAAEKQAVRKQRRSEEALHKEEEDRQAEDILKKIEGDVNLLP